MIFVDADSILYRIGFTDLGEDPNVYVQTSQSFLVKSLQGAEEIHDDGQFLVATTSEGTRYRSKFDSEYKANRKSARKPKFIKEMKEGFADILGENYVDFPSEHGEADDFICYKAYQFRKDSGQEPVIVGIDKDLFQIAGHHYNFVTGKHFHQSQNFADRFVFYQMLVGDAADNIKGLHGVGQVRANKILGVEVDSAKYRDSTYEAYMKYCTSYSGVEYVKTGNLVYLQREPVEQFTDFILKMSR